MRLIADLPESVAARIRDLVFRGRYESTQSFVLAAIENQLALEAAPEGLGVGGLADAAALLQQPSQRPPVVAGGAGGEAPLDGLINRFFPVKLAARVLANMLLREQRDQVLRVQFETAAAQAAREYGLFLLDLDLKIGRKRGERLSTGLPVGPKERNSKRRFIHSFLCGGEGALLVLGLCAVSTNLVGEAVVGLTEAGAELSRLESPLLDQGQYTAPLSAGETEFLRRHLAKTAPGEASLARRLLESLGEAGRTQASLVELIGQTAGLAGGALAQAAAGLLARMRELELVRVEGSGPQALYRPGPGAGRFSA